MNNVQIVRDYIEGIDANKPIFLDDVKKLVGDNAKMILTRLTRTGVVARLGNGHGIYYKPQKTIWGDSVIGNDTIIRYKYIEDGYGNIKGYITGARLFNHLGLTTQLPRMTEVVSNECIGKNRTVTEYGAVVRRPKVKVTGDNYIYQQFIDLVENKTNVQIESDTPQTIIQAFYKDNQLDFAVLYRLGIDRGAAKHTLLEMSRLALEV